MVIIPAYLRYWRWQFYPSEAGTLVRTKNHYILWTSLSAVSELAVSAWLLHTDAAMRGHRGWPSSSWPGEQLKWYVFRCASHLGHKGGGRDGDSWPGGGPVTRLLGTITALIRINILNLGLPVSSEAYIQSENVPCCHWCGWSSWTMLVGQRGSLCEPWYHRHVHGCVQCLNDKKQRKRKLGDCLSLQFKK